MKFTVYSEATGAVLRWGSCQDHMLQAQAHAAGEVAIEGYYPRGHFYWNGQAMAAFPAKPDETAQWNWATKAWQVDLAAAREARWDAMKQARQDAIDSPLVTPYGTFDCDERARDNIAKTAQGIQTFAGSLAPTELPTVEFTLLDNTVVTLSAQDMIRVAKLLFEKVQTAYARARQLRQDIEDAQTPQALEAIGW